MSRRGVNHIVLIRHPINTHTSIATFLLRRTVYSKNIMSLSLLSVRLNETTDYFEGVAYNGDLVDLLASSIVQNHCGRLTSADLDENSNLWSADNSMNSSATSQLSMYETPLTCELSPVQYQKEKDRTFSTHDYPINEFDISEVNVFDEFLFGNELDLSDIPDDLTPLQTTREDLPLQPMTSSPLNDVFTLNYNIGCERHSADEVISIRFPALSDSLDYSDSDDTNGPKLTSDDDIDITFISVEVKVKPAVEDDDHIDYGVLDSWLDTFCSQTISGATPTIPQGQDQVQYIYQTAPSLVVNSPQPYVMSVYDVPPPSPSVYSSVSSVSEFGGSLEGGSDYGSDRPSVSYMRMIAEAILTSPQEKVNLTAIYSYVIDNYPYFENRKSAWRNSIRHNLSVNGCFVKNGRATSGRGYFWSISDDYIKDFRRGDYARKNRYQLQHKRRIARDIERLPQPIAFTPVYVSPSSQSLATNFVTKFVPEAPVYTYRPT